jgi:hypothetical protein
MIEMMVRVLKTIGYDVGFRSGAGQYLFDREGVRYLDLLSGWGVFGIGRNHPKLRDTLTSVLAADFPNLVQIDVSPLARNPGGEAAPIHALSRQGTLCQLGRRSGRCVDETRAQSYRASGPGVLHARLPWPLLRRAVVKR